MKIGRTVWVGMCATALYALTGVAQAALVSCPSAFTADGTAKLRGGLTTNSAASACQYVTPADSSNVASIANINTAAFFGHADWLDNDQTQIDVERGSIGGWSIDDADFANYDYIIVFKDGADTNLIAFLLNEFYSFGTWLTPFTDPPFDFPGNSKEHGVSHWTIAKRFTGGRELPEPNTLALLGLGLLGLGVLRRRRIG